MKIDYNRVAKAIKYIDDHATEQPSLDEIAEAVHLSPHHFHRMFRKWAGITPKAFLQYLSLSHAKSLLQANQTIEEATFHTGLSSSSRLHDLFVNIEGMTPGEYKKGGKMLHIKYTFTESPFGRILVASTGKGICNLQFTDHAQEGVRLLEKIWPNADFSNSMDHHIEKVEKLFAHDSEDLDDIKLHIRGTDFQLKVWEALLRIPSGHLTTYSAIAGRVEKPKAARAVGSAIGQNPIAYLIPCHRVIKKVGKVGEYRWGSTRKKAIIGWEAAQNDRRGRS
ncbi:bifunctional transcriptional activator/DNA repair enzyme AdaA [Fodinibius sediminis]|uniref:methylated-DNA--[protein]-cysteine S-methyltransferase n=1 Tax=Fodinibius sediminis TaxID=1214077 RepID=A0A521BGI6_9BACT|nr:methylated-DNA--[protein]-cysteine S-methyltransferase [Fodinibius sediminis]SMO46205.1 AraC family transcriptional regulator, regulatory protein of adaptative response / methylated-DNA-[protein]-cysteine methyltransferase [Fodinibius sediminis]